MANNTTDEQWKFLRKIMPDAEQLETSLRPDLYGLVRRTIIKEHEEKVEATSVYRHDDSEALKELIASIPFSTDEEINQQVAELNLPQEDAELEVSHWAFNHQAVKGELLIDQALLPFKLIRLFQYTYLFISVKNNRDAVNAFNLAFGRKYGVFSKNALFIDHDQWCGWAWFTDPDEVRNADAQRQLKEIWEGMAKS